MLHFVQYHSPEVMECGVDEVGSPPFGVLTSKAPDNPIGSTVWIVGKTLQAHSPVYLACSFVVDDVLASLDPRFLYEYVGEEGVNYDPLRCVSDQEWYPQLLRLTGNFRFGLTEVSPSVLEGLRAIAAPRRKSAQPRKRPASPRRKRQ